MLSRRAGRTVGGFEHRSERVNVGDEVHHGTERVAARSDAGRALLRRLLAAQRAPHERAHFLKPSLPSSRERPGGRAREARIQRKREIRVHGLHSDTRTVHSETCWASKCRLVVASPRRWRQDLWDEDDDVLVPGWNLGRVIDWTNVPNVSRSGPRVAVR